MGLSISCVHFSTHDVDEVHIECSCASGWRCAVNWICQGRDGASALEGSGNIIMLSLAQFHQKESKNNWKEDSRLTHSAPALLLPLQNQNKVKVWFPFMERFFLYL